MGVPVQSSVQFRSPQQQTQTDASPRLSVRRIATVLLLLTLGLSTAVVGQEEAEAKTEKVTYNEQAILDHFHASSGSVSDDGRVELVYDFSTKDANLLRDWSPALAKTKRRIRWSQGYEGTWTTVEDGLIIADQGTFLHRAKWDGDAEIHVDYLSMSASGKKDVLATIYAWDRGKKIVGSQIGEQCIQVTRSLKVRGRPIPAEALRQVSVEDRRTFGMKMKDGVVTALRNGSAAASSEKEPKFVKKPGPGQVGLAWKGRVNGFVFRVEVSGVLSEDYLTKNIPNAIEKVVETAQAD